jgi:hypothetical protein
MKTHVKNSVLLVALLGVSGCVKQVKYHNQQQTVSAHTPPESASLIPMLETIPVPTTTPPVLTAPEQTNTPIAQQPFQVGEQITTITKKNTDKTYNSNDPNELDFDVENLTGKTVYVTCFSYMRRRLNSHWSWYKSPIYKIEHGQFITLDLEKVPDTQDRNFTFGYLGVFNTADEAKKSIFELLPETKKLDLDLLIKLKGKKVTLNIEQYGMRGYFYEYDFVKKDGTTSPTGDLDFYAENATNRPLFATCFVYEKKAKGQWIGAEEEKDDMSTWRYNKTPVIKILPGEVGHIDILPTRTERDRLYMRGYLAIFGPHEEELAQKAVYELIESNRKLNLGELHKLNNKKVVIEVQKYGIMQDILDYVVKTPKSIDFKRVK